LLAFGIVRYLLYAIAYRGKTVQIRKKFHEAGVYALVISWSFFPVCWVLNLVTGDIENWLIVCGLWCLIVMCCRRFLASANKNLKVFMSKNMKISDIVRKNSTMSLIFCYGIGTKFINSTFPTVLLYFVFDSQFSFPWNPHSDTLSEKTVTFWIFWQLSMKRANLLIGRQCSSVTYYRVRNSERMQTDK